MVEPKKQQWITTKKAAEILSERSGRAISEDYVRRLGNTGKLETAFIDGRTKLYLRADVEKYVVKERGDGSVRAAQRAPKKMITEVDA